MNNTILCLTKDVENVKYLTKCKSKEFIIVNNICDFMIYIITKGIPNAISFSHDLVNNHNLLERHQWKIYPELVESGEIDVKEFGETGYDIANWLIKYCSDNNIDLLCKIYVYDKNNQIGEQNIINILNPFMQKCGSFNRVINSDITQILTK